MILGLIASLVLPSANDLGFLVEPYLQIGNQAEVKDLTLVWHDRPNRPVPVVEYRQGLGQWQKAKSTSQAVATAKVQPFEIFSARLSGLTPGSRFQYRLITQGVEVFSYWGFTPPAKSQSQRFAVIGDCGGASLGQAGVAYYASKEKPHYLVIPGDIVYDDGTVRDYRARFFPFYQRGVPSQRRGGNLLHFAPTIGVLGNHDIGSRNLDRDPDGLAYFYTFFQPLNGWSGATEPAATGSQINVQAFKSAAGANYPVMANFWTRIGDVHWVMVDVNHYVNLREEGLRSWIKDALARGQDAKWRIVMLHHPPFHSSPRHAEAKQSRLLMEIFEDAKVDLVIAGHVHNYQRNFPISVGDKRGARAEVLNRDDWTLDKSFDGKTNTKPQGIITIVNGAGGARLYDPQLADQPNQWKPFTTVYKAVFSFGIVDVTPQRLSYRQIDQNGELLDEWAITR
ncbi:MAG: metallophosphoesterase family protein [Fimbriimonadaceae bacterium]|jgi:predicted phosphodiesterase|nr:metallophosphoesterase family protein [Fimbriimonadaceae bacterium]